MLSDLFSNRDGNAMKMPRVKRPREKMMKILRKKMMKTFSVMTMMKIFLMKQNWSQCAVLWRSAKGALADAEAVDAEAVDVEAVDVEDPEVAEDAEGDASLHRKLWRRLEQQWLKLSAKKKPITSMRPSTTAKLITREIGEE